MNSRYDILIPVLMAVVLLAAGCSGETTADFEEEDVRAFAPVAGNEQSVGETPATVASGLVAPLDVTPVVTLTVVMGQKGKDTKDRTYTLTSSAINVKWERGRCYIYPLAELFFVILAKLER